MGREQTKIVRWDKCADKKENKKKDEKRRKREEKGKRVFCFSLRSMEIGSSVFVGVRCKVHLCDESYTWVPKS